MKEYYIQFNKNKTYYKWEGEKWDLYGTKWIFFY
jgi:hypothetical protein